MPRLKVYEAEIDGLHQWVVAAPNQRAALDALGVHQDLFAQGLAKVSEDQTAIEDAQARPLTPLRRDKGSKAAFKPVGDDGSDIWRKAAAATPPTGSRKKPPSRARLDRAEAALARFEEIAERERAGVARMRAALEARENALAERLVKERRKLEAARDDARQAYRAAGGR